MWKFQRENANDSVAMRVEQDFAQEYLPKAFVNLLPHLQPFLSIVYCLFFGITLGCV